MKSNEKTDSDRSGNFRDDWIRFLEASARLHASALRTGALRAFSGPAVEVIEALQDGRRVEEVVRAWSRFQSTEGIDPAPAIVQRELSGFTETVDRAIDPLAEDVSQPQKRSRRAAVKKILKAGSIVVGSLGSVLGPFLGPGVRALLSVLEEIGEIATVNRE